MKERISKQLIALKEDLSQLEDDYFIIGSSGLHLLGVEVGVTQDIDILVSDRDAERLKLLWKKYQEMIPVTKEDDLFISNFARYKFDLMEIEVMGDLKVCKNGSFESVKVYEYTNELVGDFHLKIPTIKEFIRILSVFGREKDMEKVCILDKRYNDKR